MIEAKFIPHARKEIWYPLRPDILPGGVGAWEDRSTGVGRYVLAQCQEDNSGARVHIVEPEDITWEEDGMIADLNDDNLHCEIFAGHSCQIEIVDCDDDEGLLILQHVGHKDLMQSYN